jgi:hypothetical protein
MWRRTTEDEIRNTGRSRNEVKGIAGGRNAWKIFMDALCSTGCPVFHRMPCVPQGVKGTDDDDDNEYL